MQALSGWLLFEVDGDDIAEGQIDEFRRRGLICERLILDVPRVRPILLGDPASGAPPQGTGCARARATAGLSSERSVLPTIIVIGLALLVRGSLRVSRQLSARTHGQTVEFAGGSDDPFLCQSASASPPTSPSCSELPRK